MKALTSVVLGVFAASALVACAGVPDAARMSVPEPAETYVVQKQPSDDSALVSLAHYYPTLDSALAHADLVVIASPQGPRTIIREGMFFVVVDFTVSEAIVGDSVPQEFAVHYTGNGTSVSDLLPQVPKEGLEYLLVLSTVDLADSVESEEWIVVGPAQWVREFPHQHFGLDVVEPPDSFPPSMTVEAIEEAWAAR